MRVTGASVAEIALSEMSVFAFTDAASPSTTIWFGDSRSSSSCVSTGRLPAASFATVVQSDQPIVSERAMYWSTAGGAWQEAHNSFGVTTTGTKWGTSDGRSGGDRGYSTYVLVANTSTTATANLLATFYRSDCVRVTRTFSVGPNRRLNIDCNTVPELANSEFGVVVESTNAVPIVVERATYWNAGGIVWAGGTNVTATPVP
jgi:hypothetical protein